MAASVARTRAYRNEAVGFLVVRTATTALTSVPSGVSPH